MDDSFDNDFELAPALPNQHAFCLVLSYAFHYHLAVAKFQRLAKEALKLLHKGTAETLEMLCRKDADYVEMFKLIGTMRGLGFRSEGVRFDIEFPTRNHLKVFLARLITKRRRQMQVGLVDLSTQNSTAIISSTDYCDEKVVSALCKALYPRHGDAPDNSTRMKYAGVTGMSGFSGYANPSMRGGSLPSKGLFSKSSRRPKQEELG